MKAKHVSKLWVILPLAILVFVLYARWHTAEQHTEPDPLPTIQVEPEPTLVEPSLPPAVPVPEPSTEGVLEVCPDETFPAVTVGPTAYISDYSGNIPASIPSNSLVEITCGEAKGQYTLHTYDFTGAVLNEPDLVITACTDIMCSGTISTVSLERLDT